MEKITFCVITFDPIKIQTRSAPQNDRLNFSFVKDTYVEMAKNLEMVEKWLLIILHLFRLIIEGF